MYRQMPDTPHSLYMRQKLEERELQGNKRMLSLPETGTDFFSNDYLGIAALSLPVDPGDKHRGHVYQGATGSRLLSGNQEVHMETEDYLAAVHQAEAALLFNSGYDANLALLSTLANRHSTIIYDELCHASILDGIRLSFAKHTYHFRHNNLEDLEQKLQRYDGSGPLILVVESVYSMEGSLAPLREIVQLARQYRAALLVDEAHATGVWGAQGEGMVQHLGLKDEVFGRVHTFGKALGSHGAVVVGGQILKDFLVNFARPFIFTTALSATAVLRIRKAYEWMQAHSLTREILHQRIQYFRDHKPDLEGLYWKPAISPIQSLILGSNDRCRDCASYLRSHGLQVAAITHPTVARGTERIRICLHADHTTQQIDHLFNTLIAWSSTHI